MNRRRGNEIRWTVDALRHYAREQFSSDPIIVLSNRQPFKHDRDADGRVTVRRSTGGLITALEPLIDACDGVWVASGDGTSDAHVPDEPSRYRVRRVWLDPDDQRGYYYGFSNEGLWPLCHHAGVAAVFRAKDFDAYASVNARFAAAVLDESTTERPLVLVQDYHCALAPQLIRERMPLATIVSFWHIPWPTPAAFARCPWGMRLVQGLLGSSIVGLQTPDDCRNFVDTVESLLDVDVSRSRDVIEWEGRPIRVRPYPVSVEWPNRWVRQSASIAECRRAVCDQLGVASDVQLVVGIDRLDFTKGIAEKLLAFAELLERHPDLRGRLVFAQVAEPSRDCLPAYQALRSRIHSLRDRINARFGAKRAGPVVLIEQHQEPREVYRWLRAADVCYVGSLQDGMNLVAKEFVTARDDERGVLVLSRFAGAARELRTALTVEPHAIEETAATLASALNMSIAEQTRRMRTMRAVVAVRNTYRWAGAILTDAARVRADEDTRVFAPWWREQMPAV